MLLKETLGCSLTPLDGPNAQHVPVGWRWMSIGGPTAVIREKPMVAYLSKKTFRKEREYVRPLFDSGSCDRPKCPARPGGMALDEHQGADYENQDRARVLRILAISEVLREKGREN